MDPRELKVGDRIAAQDYNFLVRAAIRRLQGQGYTDNDGYAPDFSAPNVPPLWGICAESVPVFSLLTLTSSSTGVTSPEAPVVTVTKPASTNPQGLFTNGEVSGTKVPLVPLQFGVPFKLDVDAADTFVVGEECGPKDDSYQASPKGHGLVCLSAPATYQTSRKYIWVALAHEDHRLYQFESSDSDAFVADIKKLDDTLIKAEATLENTIGAFSHLEPEGLGLCISVGDKFYPIFPPAPSSGGGENVYMIEFVLTSDLDGPSSATASATVLSSTDPSTPPTTTVTVNAFGHRSWIDCSGLAVKTDGEWWVVECNQHTPLWQAELTAPTHDFSSGAVPGNIASQNTIAWGDKLVLFPFPLSYAFNDEDTVVDNPHNFKGLTGDTILVSHDPIEDTDKIIAIFPANARRFVVKATGDIANGLDSYVGAAGTRALGFEPGEVPSSPTVKDKFYLAHNMKSNDEAFVEYNYKTADYEIFAAEHTATEVLGRIKTTVGSTPATFDVKDCVGINGKNPSGDLTVQNRYSWLSVTANHEIEIRWDPINGVWFPRQMECQI